MDNITFGRYIPIDSFVHRLDPRLKISGLFIFLIAIFFDAGFIGYGIQAVFVAIVIFLAKLNITHILKAMRPLVFMILLLSVFNIFLIQTGTLLLSVGFLNIYSGALYQSSYILIRLVLIISLTTILTSTTKPLELTLAIESLLNPLKRFNFPTHELAMMISIALRFIPDLLDETKKIMKAQASRGVDFDEGTLMEKIKAITSLIIPLFITAIQRAEDLANAMESRNYNPEATRTRYHVLTWENTDTISLVFIIVVCLIVIALSVVL